MAQAEIREIARRYRSKLEGTIHPIELILFGSHARGNPGPESDIDIAVVVNKVEGDYLEFLAFLWRVGREVDDRIEPVLIIEGSDLSGFYRSIKSYGETIA